MFGGFPLGLENLLTHRARVSGYSDDGFFIDGAVNQANSGGPIVSWESGRVLGVVTFKGFVSPEELQELVHYWMKLRQQAKQGGGISVGGINPAALAEVTAVSFDALENLIRTNASTGIGGAISISYINEIVDSENLLD